MDFGNRLKVLRKEHGYSQESFAQELNMSRQAISKWESGQGYPEMTTLIQISQIFGVTIDYLLKGKETDSINEKGYYVSKELLEGFTSYKRHSAKRIAIGISLLLISSNFFLISDRIVGITLTWLCVVCGLTMLIWQKFIPNNYKVIYSKELLFDENTIKLYKIQHSKNKKLYGILTIIGVILIVSSSPIEFILTEYNIKLNYAIFQMILFITAIDMFILVWIPFSAEIYIMESIQGISQKKGKAWLYLSIPITIFCIILGLFYNTWSPIVPIIVFICLLLYNIYKYLTDRGEK